MTLDKKSVKALIGFALVVLGIYLVCDAMKKRNRNYDLRVARDIK